LFGAHQTVLRARAIITALQDNSSTLLFYLGKEDVRMKLGPGEPSAAPWRVVPVRDFVGLVFDSRTHARPWILAVDGRGGNGKSTIAELLHHAVPNSLVIHTDDIAWHHSFFDWGDLLIEDVLKPLHSGKAVRYQPPGWQTHGRIGSIEIAAALSLVIVEGVGASRIEAMSWIDRSIWVQSDLDEAKRRCLAREGNTEEARTFWDEWMSEEVDFLQRQRPWERATAIVNNTPTQPYDRSSQIVVSAASPCFTSTTSVGS
jgi:pentatricopeptide repeat protein